jgi:hypothetical protein
MTEKEKITATAENVLNFLGVTNKKSNEDQKPTFEIEVSELSSMFTPIAFNPNRDVVEDRHRLIKFNQK